MKDHMIKHTLKMMTSRYNGDEEKKDIHEANVEYLQHCRKAAKAAATQLGWSVIDCADNDMPRSIESIGDEIENLITKFTF